MGTHADTAFDPGLPPDGELDIELTDEQVAAFERDGFVTVGRITTDEELEWLRTIYDFLFAEKQGAFVGGYFDLSRPYNSEGDDHVPQIINPETRYPVLRETLYWRNGRQRMPPLPPRFAPGTRSRPSTHRRRPEGPRSRHR